MPDLECRFNISNVFWSHKFVDMHNNLITVIDSGQVLLAGDNGDWKADCVCLNRVRDSMTVIRCGSDMVSTW